MLLKQINTKLGQCAVCGDRVYSNQKYLRTQEGYCHKNCLPNKTVKETAKA